jgi:hypothetical protein
MARLPIVSWIGNAAAVLTGTWGAVVRQTEDAGCSRQTAYDHAKKVAAAVRDAAASGPSRKRLQQQLQQQTAAIAALKKKLADATEFPKEEQQRFAATATAMGLSYSQARELLEIVVKKNAPVERRSRDG